MSFAEGYLMGLQIKERQAQDAVRAREFQQQFQLDADREHRLAQQATDDREEQGAIAWANYLAKRPTATNQYDANSGNMITIPADSAAVSAWQGGAQLLQQALAKRGISIPSQVEPAGAQSSGAAPSAVSITPIVDLTKDPGIQNLMTLVPAEDQPLAQSLVKIGGRKPDLVKELSSLINKPAADTTAHEQARYLGALQKKNLGQPLSPEDQAFVKSYEHMKSFAGEASAKIRIEGLAQTREYPVLNQQTGQLEMKDAQAINAAPSGMYAPAAGGTQAMQKRALIEDIRGAIGNVGDDLKALKSGFNSSDRGRLAVALADPSTSASQYLQSFARDFSPEQQQYTIDLFALRENAMAMRSVLGAGQGSEDLRRAIVQTLPGPGTPSADYAQKQLQRLSQVLDRLERGVPNVPLSGGTGTGAQSPSQAAAPTPDRYAFSVAKWKQAHPRANPQDVKNIIDQERDKGFQIVP